jgi:hypothetical protein
VSRHTVYKAGLKEAAGSRAIRKGDDQIGNITDLDCGAQATAEPSPVKSMPIDSALLSDKIRGIIFGKNDEISAEKDKRKQSGAVEKLKAMFPVLLYVIQFLKIVILYLIQKISAHWMPLYPAIWILILRPFHNTHPG